MEQKIAIANFGSDPPQTAISIQMIGGGGGAQLAISVSNPWQRQASQHAMVFK